MTTQRVKKVKCYNLTEFVLFVLFFVFYAEHVMQHIFFKWCFSVLKGFI